MPHAGPLTITSAPQGKSAQASAQRDGTLEFKGANGTTGTLHLSDDSVTVVEVWETRADQESWMADKLGPALARAGVAAPRRVEWMTLLGHHTP